ncbi:hypothetical protein ABWW58_02615 [Sporolactobacillus sp. STCC-11]|uniref:hypothetical protein n=1 Tax=Sporolactobacillus caesalpiniae TaxID=3230362 RepID=UPI003393036B
MEYSKLFLIEAYKNSRVVSAKTSVEALNIFIEERNREFKEDGRQKKYDPSNLKITFLCEERFILRAAE